ncbi:MAG: hypothetical protein ACI4EM_05740 [Hominisplanchenecus sp.]
MKKRTIFRMGGFLLFLAAFFIEGMVFVRVKGSEPEHILTAGNVYITVQESRDSQEEMNQNEHNGYSITIEDARPGEEIRRKMLICMGDGSETAYLRMKLRVESDGLSGQQKTELQDSLSASSGWTHNHQDGYYYYDAPVLEGKKIPVLEKICIPENWEKPVCFQIDLTVHAVQASWLTPRFGADCRMLGWIPTERLLKLGWINDI